MNRQLEIKAELFPTLVKMGIFFWMFSIIFVYLLLFGPPEFWSISERIGLSRLFQEWRGVLQPVFTAAYLS